MCNPSTCSQISQAGGPFCLSQRSLPSSALILGVWMLNSQRTPSLPSFLGSWAVGRVLIIANIYRNPIHDPSSTSSQSSKHCLNWGSISANCNSVSPQMKAGPPKMYHLASVSLKHKDDYLDPGLVVNISQLAMMKACHPDLPLMRPWASLLAWLS